VATGEEKYFLSNASADAKLQTLVRVAFRRRQEDRSFGASFRRLRLQRRLGRADLPGVSSKTIARIERGETGKPHGKTLAVLANALGVKADEIETY
jgi:hypothetical protein